jgi:hypothetical protein
VALAEKSGDTGVALLLAQRVGQRRAIPRWTMPALEHSPTSCIVRRERPETIGV